MIPEKFRALVQAPHSCARIVAHDRNSYVIANQIIETRAEISGKFRYENPDPSSMPVVGDYVRVSAENGTTIIHAVLPRANLFARRSVFGSHDLQAIAANIDTLFLVMSVNRDFNLRRLERYMVAASACKVPCAVVLTKIDLQNDPASFISAAQHVAGEIPVMALSAVNDSGIDQLDPFRGIDKTLSFVGSSGVGKSTLINKLLKTDQLIVGETRQDDRGRHTTTRRSLLHLEDGTAIIDTPGMREFAHADAEEGVSATFAEIDEIARECRFRDCKHDTEPGCAVRDSVEESRLTNWRKLEKEAAFEARKSDRLLAAVEKQKWKIIHKEARKRKRD